VTTSSLFSACTLDLEFGWTAVHRLPLERGYQVLQELPRASRWSVGRVGSRQRRSETHPRARFEAFTNFFLDYRIFRKMPASHKEIWRSWWDPDAAQSPQWWYFLSTKKVIRYDGEFWSRIGSFAGSAGGEHDPRTDRLPLAETRPAHQALASHEVSPMTRTNRSGGKRTKTQAGGRDDGGEWVRAFVHVRGDHDHAACPPSRLWCKVDGRRTRLAWERSHAPMKSRQTIPIGDERHSARVVRPEGRQAERESARRRSGPSPSRRTAPPPTSPIQTASWNQQPVSCSRAQLGSHLVGSRANPTAHIHLLPP